MGTAIKHPVPDQVKQSFVMFDIRALWHSGLTVSVWASECPDVKNYNWRLNPVWHRMLYSCTHMATVGMKGLTAFFTVKLSLSISLLNFVEQNFVTVFWKSNKDMATRLKEFHTAQGCNKVDDIAIPTSHYALLCSWMHDKNVKLEVCK